MTKRFNTTILALSAMAAIALGAIAALQQGLIPGALWGSSSLSFESRSICTEHRIRVFVEC